MRLHKRQFLLSLTIPIVLILAACSAGGQNPALEPEPGVTTLIYAKIRENGVDQEWIDKFNTEHEGEIHVEVRDYSKMSEGGQQGIDLLMTEIGAGKVPDIIELGTSGETTELPYWKLAKKGLLEDLWPYIENDGGLGRVGVMEVPLKASEINGGLYTVFESFRFHTLTGAKSVVGDRTSWTVEDLLEAFEAMPEGSVILDAYEDYSVREHLLASFLYGFSDLFIDWESGQCFFDDEIFRSILGLAKRVPDECTWHQYYKFESDIKIEYQYRLQDGIVMLDDTGWWRFYNFREMVHYFGEPVSVGYPVGDGSNGFYIEPCGLKLAMSSACEDKDAAWQFIRRIIYPRQKEYGGQAFFVNRKTYNQRKALERKTQTACWDENRRIVYLEKPMMAEETDYVESLFDTNRSSILLDKNVRDIVLEVAGAYFAGDRDLDQTVQLLNSRVGLYLNEQR